MEYTLDIHENVVSCDKITKLKTGYYYKGHNGATYKLTYYTYANEWCDKEHVIYGKTIESVLAHYEKATHRLNDRWNGDPEELTTEELAYMVEDGE